MKCGTVQGRIKEREGKVLAGMGSIMATVAVAAVADLAADSLSAERRQRHCTTCRIRCRIELLAGARSDSNRSAGAVPESPRPFTSTTRYTRRSSRHHRHQL